MTDNDVQILFPNYELDFMLQYLLSHIQQIKRHHPHLTFQTPSLRRNFTLLQFNPNTNPKILAFDLFVFKIEMVQSFRPEPHIYFTGVLQNLIKLFPTSYLLTDEFQPSEIPTPIIPLQTEDGSIYPHPYWKMKTRNLLSYTPLIFT